MLAIAFPNYYMYLYHCLKDFGKLTHPLCQKFIGVKVGWNLTISKEMSRIMDINAHLYHEEDYDRAEAFLKKYVLKHVSKKKAKEFCIEIIETPLPEDTIKDAVDMFLKDKITFKELKAIHFLRLDEVYMYEVLNDGKNSKKIISLINKC